MISSLHRPIRRLHSRNSLIPVLECATRPPASLLSLSRVACSRKSCYSLFICFVFAFVAVPTTTATESERPNIVVILTDNHGAWTLGCYGNSEIATPHIDRLAQEGTLLTRAFANNPVCSPTRASLLTGLMPSQHGVHCFLFNRRLQVGPEARCTLDQFRSLPEILRDAGYACGLVGKWHLGDNLHPQEGLDDYWITMPHGATTTFYGADIIENGKIRKEPEYLTDFWTKHAVKFIRGQAKGKQPFFLFLSYNGPYALGGLLRHPGKNRHVERYAQAPLASFPREPAHPWQYNNLDFLNNPTSIRRVACEVSGVDDGVGTVMRTLREEGLAENTIVLFLADQGWVGGHGGFFGMGDHTRPATARDGMMRIPMVWWHPGRITQQRSDLMVSGVDVMPTLLSYLGIADQMPETPHSPGRDFSPLLRGEDVGSWKSEVFYEFETLRCIRTDRWKLVRRFPNGPDELYDLQADPVEGTNLVDEPPAQAVRRQLATRLDQFFETYADNRYDLWHGGGSQTRLLIGVEEANPVDNKAAPPPLPGDFRQPEIRVPDGFSVELAAGPPLVQHPTMAAIDDRGRLFVCENAGVNLSAQELEKQLPNSITLLTDTDNDGRYDHKSVFADKMTFPMGAVWYRGALYVASPPYIWKLEDTDDDGVADRRTVLVSKFGYTGNAASIHGCFLGPDGRLYWCDGYHGHEFEAGDDGKAVKREGSYLFSCLPDGSDVRVHCGGGMDNPVEVDFTPAGEMLGTVNILYTRPRVDCLVHWLYGGTYPHRERVLAERQTTGPFLGPMHRFGHVAVSGMARYRSGIADRKWRDDLFTTFFNSGKVVRVHPLRDGSTYKAEQFEFLSSPSRDFHPTDVLEDADGSLLVVDTGGWFYRGCPTSQLAKPDVKGGIYRIRRRGAPRQNDPLGLDITWNKLKLGERIQHLGDTRFAVRDRAIESCAQIGPAAIGALANTLKHRDLPWRLGAIWALCRIANDQRGNHKTVESVLAALRPALDDPALDARLAALHVFSLHPSNSEVDRLITLLGDDEPAVRRRAAVALGRIGDKRAVAALLDAAAGAVDRAEDHAAIYALIEINDAGATSRGLLAKHPATQRAALVALDQQTDPAAQQYLTAEKLAPFLRSDDPPVAEAALRIMQQQAPAGLAQAAAPLLESWLASADAWRPRADLVRQLTHHLLGEPAIGQLVGRRLSDAKLDAETRSLLLAIIGSRKSAAFHPSWKEPLAAFLARGDAALRAETIGALRRTQDGSLRKRLNTIMRDDNEPLSIRLAALDSLVAGSSRFNDATLDMMLTWLEEEAGPSDRLRLVQLIGRASLTDSQLLALTDSLPTAGPLELSELIRPFMRTQKKETAAAFLESVESARALESLAEHELSDVIKKFPHDLLPRANKLIDRIKSLQQQKAESLDQYLVKLDQASIERGRKVFFSEKAKCSTCHKVGKEGENIGPDLTTIGDNRSAKDLLESILFPSSTIVRQYEPYTVQLSDGRVISGLIAGESSDRLVLQPQTGDPVALDRDEIEVMQMSTVSIMPAGLEKELTAEQLTDVVRYLLSCRKPTQQAHTVSTGPE